jgi:K+-sensing histidine kinase KdpD
MRIDPVLHAHRGSVIAGSIVIPVLACWLLSLVPSGVANTNAALGLVLLVVAAASTGIRVAGIAAALAAAAGFDFFLTQPFRTFSIHSSGDLVTALLLLVVGAAVSEIAIWGRRQQAQASREQGYLDGLLNTAAAVAAGTETPTELVNLVANQIVSLLHIDACRFDPAVRYGLPTLSSEGTLTRNGHDIDISRRGLPTDTSFALEVRHAGTVYGHYILTASTRAVRPSRAQLRVAGMLAEQVGGALATRPAVRPDRAL